MGRATTAASGDPSPASGSSARPSSPTGRRSGSGSSKRRRRTAAKLFRHDRDFGCRFVAGADEAGRGSLAGPLVAAAVLLDYQRLGLAERRALTGLDDSKRKTVAERDELYPKVLAVAAQVRVAIRCVRGIDDRGLHNTNLEALSSCIEGIDGDPVVRLVDGFRLPDCRLQHAAVVEGDSKSAAIAAASIVAKVTRDRYMHRADGVYPGWNFAGNVGYSTEDHREAIVERGISILHRRSFQSVAYTQLDIAAQG